MHFTAPLIAASIGFLLSSGMLQAAEIPPSVSAVSPPAWLQRGGSTTALRAGTPLQPTDVISVGSTGGAVILFDQIRLTLQEKTTWIFAADADNGATARPAGILLEGGASIDASHTLTGAAPLKLALLDLSDKPAIIEPGSIAGALVSAQEATLCLERGSAAFDGAVLSGRAEHRRTANPADPRVPDGASQCPSLATGGAEGLWISREGRWQVNLHSDLDSNVAQGLFNHYRNNGYPVNMIGVFVGGKDYQRIYMPGFASQAAAAAMAYQLRGRLPGVDKPWVLASPQVSKDSVRAMGSSPVSAAPRASPKSPSSGTKRTVAKKKIPQKKIKPVAKLRAKQQ